uniref:Uncharacterized protein n=1 Tax=Odontella aurita TaxID=265563 RepID=A0A7S4I2A2_9STRA
MNLEKVSISRKKRRPLPFARAAAIALKPNMRARERRSNATARGTSCKNGVSGKHEMTSRPPTRALRTMRRDRILRIERIYCHERDDPNKMRPFAEFCDGTKLVQTTTVHNTIP